MHRNSLKSKAKCFALIFLLAVAAGCSADSSAGPDDTSGRPAPTLLPSVTVITDQAELSGFVTPGNGRVIPLVQDSGTSNAAVAPERNAPATQTAEARAALVFRLAADVGPPIMSGQTLQATHIVQKGSEVYVTYATVGEATFGAVDVFVVNKTVPQLVSRAVFATTEYYAVDFHGSDLFLVGATADSGFGERAVLDVVDLSKKRLPTPFAAIRIQLPSYAGTGVSVDGKYVWVTSGSGGPNTGGLSIFDKKKLTLLGRSAFLDARGVFSDGKYALVMSGTPGAARLFNASSQTSLGAAIAVGGATIPESKGMAWVDGDWSFLAAGDGGTKVVALSNSGGALRGSGIPTPTVAGVPASRSTTNAVFVDAQKKDGVNYVFVANGEAGVQAYASDHRSRKFSETPRFTYQGRLGFGTMISANYITGGSGTLVIAAGLGGLNILTY
jgi:hypothetical protein